MMPPSPPPDVLTGRPPGATGVAFHRQHSVRRIPRIPTMDATRLIIVRHGETEWNADGRIQGHTDIALNAVGRWQADRVGHALADESIAAIYTSDLQRARQTAEAIAAAQAAPPSVVEEARLRERAFGDFEGRTFAAVEAVSPEQAQRWRRRDPAFAPAGGENLLDFRRRIVDAVAELAARHLGDLIVLTAHGGVLDVLYRAATGQDLQAPRTWNLANAAVNRLLWTPQGFVLVGWGDARHLATGSVHETGT